MRKTTFGVIIGNRGFFPDVLARDGRNEILRLLQTEGFDAFCLTPEETKFGSVETLADALKCADLFKKNGDKIDGILVSLPNFGDERAVANTIRLSGLDVPVLVQAYPDESNQMLMGRRRDSFCGKLSACNNLWQYGIKFTITTRHTVSPVSASFKADLKSFAATCRIVKGLKNLRVGVIGARPAAFNTVRFKTMTRR
jgi:L-fucose isomerase-like protein